MYLSYKWLKELAEIPKDVSPEILKDKLTLHTVEVEGVERQRDRFRNIVVGEILELKPHPDADKLQLAEVDIGGERLGVVCGAFNIEKGQKVPVARPGTVLPDGSEIKETRVRGEISQGMLCAEDELGLGDDHSGILILEEGAKPGQELADYLRADDVVFEVDNKSLTNRPDLVGHLGIAREISVFLDVNKTAEFNKIFTNRVKSINQGGLDIRIEDNDLCPRYLGFKIDNISVQESPEWLRKRLTAVGIRPVNNIVDATNYIMLETGQPMHAFDAGKVEGIRVRRARAGEVLRTLDGENRELSAEDLVIADKEKPIALAGIMGGESTEITESTTSVILEAANFDPVAIRKTSQKARLRTDSSSRFEKSLDPYLLDMAMAECWDLIRQVSAGAAPGSALTDVASRRNRESRFGVQAGPLKADPEEIRSLTGVDIEDERIINILTKLGFKVEKKEDKKKEVEVTVPTWRGTKDISGKEDLIEEVIRIYGYNNIQPRNPLIPMDPPPVPPEKRTKREIRDILSRGAAMSETYNYPFTNEEKLKKMNCDATGYIRVANPISNTHTLLKQNLAVNLVDNIKQNQAGYDHIAIFEIGDIFLNMAGKIDKDATGRGKLPYQEAVVGMVEGGEKKDVFRAIKGKVEYLFRKFHLEVKFLPSDLPLPWADSSRFAKVVVEGRDAGIVGCVKGECLNSLGIKKKTAIAEVKLRDIVDLSSQKDFSYRPLSRYPALRRDLAFVVDVKVLYNDIKEEIENFSELIKKVELFDVYQGDKLDKRQKSLAFHVTYRSQERTLKAEEVDQLQQELFERLQEKFGAKVRDF